jgi:hypothetical protein
MKRERLLLIQPGRFGDIVICLPIAEYYSRDFEVDWLCPEEFHSPFRNVRYCRPVADARREDYARVIDLGFGLCPESDAQAWWIANQHRFDSFVTAKYDLAGVPLEQRWQLRWDRDLRRERELFKTVVPSDDYVLFHDRGSSGPALQRTFPGGVRFEPISDYSVFDWYEVVVRAREIHCIDSLLCNFVDAIPEAVPIPKVFYRLRNTQPQLDTLVRNNWTTVSSPS